MPVLLDLFCGAGGAAVGYFRAGFEVVGVDINPQPHYPFRYIQADVMTLDLDRFDFDAVHASPPCQAYSRARVLHKNTHLDFLTPTRARLIETGKPWVIENVPGAPMRADYVLCGSMFGLPRLVRHRWFETSWGGFQLAQMCRHDFKRVKVFGHPNYRNGLKADWAAALGIDWMTGHEMAQAIPPAYTEYIGHELVQSI